MNKIARMTRLAAALVLLASAALAQQALTVPSGQPITLGEVLIDDRPGATWIRFRFVAPQIGNDAGQIDYETSSADIDYLCEALVLPYLAQYDLTPARVVISLSDRSVPFGTSDPDATQFFESYSPDKTGCIWEAF
jgi:Family of unknown function (DUF6497)